MLERLSYTVSDQHEWEVETDVSFEARNTLQILELSLELLYKMLEQRYNEVERLLEEYATLPPVLELLTFLAPASNSYSREKRNLRFDIQLTRERSTDILDGISSLRQRQYKRATAVFRTELELYLQELDTISQALEERKSEFTSVNMQVRQLVSLLLLAGEIAEEHEYASLSSVVRVQDKPRQLHQKAQDHFMGLRDTLAKKYNLDLPSRNTHVSIRLKYILDMIQKLQSRV